MSTEKLKYLSEATLNELYANIGPNLGRYRDGDFTDMVESGGWSLELSLEIDLSYLTSLEGTSGPETEVKNSLLVWDVLSELSPSLASEDRIWTRLTHVECLTYSRARWLDISSDELAEKSVEKHFFADTLTKYRDDNAISRLWWTAYIAKLAFPENQKQALELILQKADIRLNLIERPWISSRTPVVAAIIRTMANEPWVCTKESNFRSFMKVLNKFGGGILFEMMEDAQLDEFMADCAAKAQAS